MTDERTDELPSDHTVVDAEHAPPRRPSRGRVTIAALTGVVAVLVLHAGVVGFWTVNTATDSDRFESKVESLLEREEISDSLARRIVGEIAVAVDIQGAVESVVPEQFYPIVGVLLAGVRSRVEDRVGEVIRTPAVAGNIAAAAGRAHAAAVGVLEGDTEIDGVQIVDGEVRINLLPLTARAIGVMQEIGLFSDVVVPEFTRDGDPAEQRAQLAAALGRDLPDDFGQPVVFRSQSLDEIGSTVRMAQDVFLLAKRVFWLLLIVGVGLAALSIWLSTERWRSASFIVAGLFLMTLMIRLVIGRVGDRLPNVVTGPGAKETVRQVVGGLETSLNDTLIGYSSLALLVLVVAGAVLIGYPAWQRRKAVGAD